MDIDYIFVKLYYAQKAHKCTSVFLMMPENNYTQLQQQHSSSDDPDFNNIYLFIKLYLSNYKCCNNKMPAVPCVQEIYITINH